MGEFLVYRVFLIGNSGVAQVLRKVSLVTFASRGIIEARQFADLGQVFRSFCARAAFRYAAHKYALAFHDEIYNTSNCRGVGSVRMYILSVDDAKVALWNCYFNFFKVEML